MLKNADADSSKSHCQVAFDTGKHTQTLWSVVVLRHFLLKIILVLYIIDIYTKKEFARTYIRFSSLISSQYYIISTFQSCLFYFHFQLNLFVVISCEYVMIKCFLCINWIHLFLIPFWTGNFIRTDRAQPTAQSTVLSVHIFCHK